MPFLDVQYNYFKACWTILKSKVKRTAVYSIKTAFYSLQSKSYGNYVK